jgi:beta-catenin-like protein 1
MENLFNALCSILNEPELKYAFSALEGVELMALIMKEKSVARTRAIKVMAYATQTEDGKVCCEHFVEALGLKSLFAAFMGKGGPKKNKTSAAFATPPLEDEEHVLSILASLFTSLDSETPARIRTLAKFVENDYEKVDRLLEMREAAEGRLSRTNREVEIEKQVRCH